MYSIVNIPHAKDKREIDCRVSGPTVSLVAVDQTAAEGFRELGMDSMYIGDHMMAKPADLRLMIGRALVHAVTRGRDVGYRQAQADIRNALGVK